MGSKEHPNDSPLPAPPGIGSWAIDYKSPTHPARFLSLLLSLYALRQTRIIPIPTRPLRYNSPNRDYEAVHREIKVSVNGRHHQQNLKTAKTIILS